jgi:hypothetical protein
MGRLTRYKPMIRYFAALLLLCFFVFPPVLPAQPRAVIVRTQERPAIDGILSEDIWSTAIPVTEFVQREPRNGAPATERTEFLLLFDERYLYIGIRCWDDPAKVIGREMARDVNLGNDDRVQIILDTHLDGRNAYWFQIGPRGSIGDAIISENGAGFHREWQGVWEGRATIQPHGWEAEIAIPFNTLNFDASRKDWGIKFIRYIRRNQEAVYWPTANLNNHRFQVSDAGLLTGLDNISQGMGLDINPYGISGLDYLQGPGGSGMADAGMDVFYQFTPGLRGVLTLNTDFAETEADTRQINLTRFSLHFPEKRDFFLDGENYFNFGISSGADNPYARRLIPFFSRRLGLDSGGEPLAINAGGRFTGQAGNWNMGFMNIYQEKAYGDRNFSAMRVSRNIGRQSSAGMIATLGNATAPGDNALYGVDAKIATSEFAGNKNLSFIAYGLQSVTAAPGTARSADHAFGAEVNYPNDLFYGRAGFMQIDQDFSAGMGFVPRTGVREFYFSAGTGPRPGRWGILQILSMAGINHISGTDGSLQTRETDLTLLHTRFTTGESVIARTVISHEHLQHEFNLLGTIPIPAGSYDFTTHSLSLSSARHRNLWSTVSVSRGDFYSGERKTIGVNAGWQVFLHLFLGAEMENSFLRFPGTDMDVGIYRLIINTVFTPRINLHTFVQYDDISRTAGWQSRLRLIIRPGREVFLSWNSSILDPMDRFAITESSLRFKLKYNVRF